MVTDLQKAGLWKRVAAWLLDVMMIAVLAVGVGALLSSLLKYDSYSKQFHDGYTRYEQQYGVKLDISPQEYDALSAEQKEVYDQALEAVYMDAGIARANKMMNSIIMVMISLSLLTAILIWEFFIPLWLGNGQTVGKKVFALGVMRIDGVKISTFQLFARSILGKYAVETMFPIYLIIMMFMRVLGIIAPIIVLALLVTQLVLMGVTHTSSAIHDALASTVVVDISSQQIFKSTDELMAYTKKLHAQEAQRKEY